MYFQTLRCPRCPNQVYDDLVRFQWYASPVPRDVTEQPMFNLVPLARARRKMTHFDNQAGTIGEPLQLRFPQPIPMTVAPAAISGNQQTLDRAAVSLLAVSNLKCNRYPRQWG